LFALNAKAPVTENTQIPHKAGKPCAVFFGAALLLPRAKICFIINPAFL